MASFVNPYTFVRLPTSVRRGAPSRHHRLSDDALSGVLEVQMVARTPLLLGAVQGDGGPQPPRRVRDDRVFVAGSALHGAFRSVHETLVGGCLRVIDLDYLPVHRHPALGSVTAGMRIAIVASVDAQGRASTVRIAGPAGSGPVSTAWFRLSDLRAGLGPNIRSGSRFTVSQERFEARNGKTQCVSGVIAAASDGDDSAWRILLTDTAARDAKGSTDKVYFVAARNFGAPVPVSPTAWARYLELADGADDLRTGNKDTAEFPEVRWPPDPDGELIGHRFRVTRSMAVGQPAWVNAGVGGEVIELRPAQLWRFRGDIAVRDRMSAELHPCHDWHELCCSCQVFGSADTRLGVKKTIAEQNSYGGHVGFFDAITESEPEVFGWLRAPLMAPRPSAGQFYLDHQGLSGEVVRGDSKQAPKSHWGSEADRPTRRGIRGRKFYWRTEEPEQGLVPRGRARTHQEKSETVKQVALIRAGTRFGFQVVFDGVTREQLGGVIACLQPGLLFPGEDVVTSIGGGKPFGFGAVATTVGVVRAQNAQARYLGAQTGRSVDIAELVQEFAGSVDPRVRATVWPEFAAVSTLGRVDDNAVWYPPGEGERGSETYDQGFDFWSRSGGRSMKIGDRTVRTRLVGPPSPTAADQNIDLQDPLR